MSAYCVGGRCGMLDSCNVVVLFVFCFSCGSLGLLEMVKSLSFKMALAFVLISVAGCRGRYSCLFF